MHQVRRVVAIVIAAIAAAVSSIASAQTYSVVSLTPASVGTVATAASGPTVFLNNSSGSVQVVSGGGNLIAGPYAYETVTIRCVDQANNRCSNAANQARVQVGRTGVNTGRALTITTMTATSGSATVGSGTTNSTTTLDFPLSGWTATNQTLTFLLSIALPISGDDAATATGAASSQFYVNVAKNPTVPPSSGVNGTITATVRRSLSITKVSNLQFGSFIAPTIGTNIIAVDAAGVRARTNSSGTPGTGTAVLVPSTSSAAQFTAKGEPTTTFSLDYQNSFAMSGPGTALTVTLTPSPLEGTQTIPASGTLALATGGSFSVPSGQKSGSYVGSFTTTIVYN